MKRSRCLFFLSLGFGAFAAVTGCENDPAEAFVTNEFAATGDTAFVVEKAWYRTTLFTTPLAPSEVSPSLRVGSGTEHAYAIVRAVVPEADDAGEGGAGDGGSPEQRPAPRYFVARTNDPIGVEPSKSVRIAFSIDTSSSACFGRQRLSEADWNFIAERIFPGEVLEPFASACAASPSLDAGPDAADAGADAPANAADARAN